MKTRHFILLIVCFYCSTLNAQNCWTPESNVDVLAGVNPNFLGNPGPYTVRIYAHIVRMTNQSGGATVNDIYSSINIISTALAPHNICVSLKWIDYINDNDLYSNWNSGVSPSDLESHSYATDGINIYFLPPSNPISGGMAHNTGGSRAMSIGGMYFGYVGYLSGAIVHEFGHCLALEHTHRGTHWCSAGVGCEENVERVGVHANCGTCGDYVCDTPADPCLDHGTNVNHTTCQYTLTVYDTWSQLYVPDEENFMAYTWVTCMNHFTSGQGQRMRDILAGAGMQSAVISDDIYFQNVTFSSLPPPPSTEMLYAAPSGVTAGENVTAGTTGLVIIDNLARIEFRGQNYIDLEPGFFVNNTTAGTRFEAIVDPSYCSTNSEFNSARIGHNLLSVYNPVLTNTSWLASLHGFEGYQNSLFSVVGDTSINGVGYKKVLQEYVYLQGINNDLTINGQNMLFLREDNSLRTLYQYILFVGEKTILNFSMQVGDTLQSQIVSGYVLTTIDSILTNQGYRSRFIFTDTSSVPIIWVEGVGNLASPFFKDLIYDTTFAQLLCVHENANLVYEYPYFFIVNCNLFNSIGEVGQYNDFLIVPNPNVGQFKLLFNPYSSSVKEISIFDFMGKAIARYQKENSVQMNIDLSQFPKGIYFIKVIDAEKTLVKRLVLQ